ncbi:pullulanase-type alpha-1,6-glucosidase [Ornithinimicrobium cryptoxanthini]|uniref:Pullulanase-type alpha-1,6-glucosidase n=1 Tax=Ornithinimicrobium cryptoxanthini TaxID=2934161 RepID=A0ABY4YJZ4_9MICO|nr:pullulanase-type alpha-1,6-glucosidase [Ornithinimicrobium cryptoxanthini]USQ77056.1 pullulanase-type alpha-1,6-glucosidase [Ornithinimicrobium cryptoxanthini]
MPRLLPAALATAAVVATAALSPANAATEPAVAAEPAVSRSVTLVGSLQDELGCAADWAPDCTATQLDLIEAGGSAYSGVFAVPAGAYEFKFAINGSWDESHPADNVPLVLEGPATIEFGYDDETNAYSVTPTDLAGGVSDEDRALAGDSLRKPVTSEQFYFVMADRFANGDETNDRGGIEGDRLDHGFDPTDKGFYHGGDLAGIREQLDYIEGLGTTALWLTPSFKNRPVQGSGADASAGYHGYWITDFTQIDPHLGSNEEMRALIDDAHARGIKVYFDIITNHTADIIDYEGDNYGYVSKETSPYRTATGEVFDDADYAGTDTFPEVDPATSFPYVPTFRAPEDATVKVPEWLNDPRMYHNRGDSSFAGESSTYGDFVGLDDLWTERHEVVDGMVDIYATWADFGIDGFRVDTVKHVNMEFWQEFSPRVLESAREGNADFFMFGEVYDGDPRYLSQYTTTGALQATIDFGFQGRSIDFAKGAATTSLRDFYAMDDYYTDTDSNAYQLPTFTGNHDMGRAAMMLAGAGFSGDDLQARVELTNELMFLTRGQPVVYYGDEQGFIGSGGDKDARQDMFATQVQQYAEEPLIAAPSGSVDRFDTGHPLYEQIAGLADLREEHPALVDGAQIHRYASSDEGIFAFSRLDADEQVEYLVVANNSTETKTATIPTYGVQNKFTAIYGDSARLKSNKVGNVTVEVAPLSVEVYEGKKLKKSKNAPAVYLTDPSAGGTVGGRAEIGAATPDNVFAQVTFAYRPVGTTDWMLLGTDDNAPYRVFHDVSGMPHGTLVEYRAILQDASGKLSVDSSYGVVGDPASDGGGGEAPEPIGPITQPDFVSAPGSHNSEMGCLGDWEPGCDQAQLTLDADDQIWKGTYDLPAGDYAYKAAIDKSWAENYGQGGAPGGADIPYTAPGGDVTFYYDHATHWITSDAQSPILTAPGTFQSELGCPGDWSPDCMRPWLQDPDGDGTWTWSSTQVPAGNYEFKVAHGLSWDESYPGQDVPVSVPSDGVVLTISYVLATHEVTATTSEAGVAPDLKSAKAHWLTPGILAWPADSVPAGAEPALLDWRLHWSPDGGLAVDAEAVTGGQSWPLTYDPAGLPADVVAEHPELADYLALRLDKKTAKNAGEILRGQVAVGMYDDLGRLKDATGVQIPGVLDELYARAAGDKALGAEWKSGKPTPRLWAPTAHDVDLLLWPAGAAGDAAVEDAQRIDLKRAKDGTWSVKGDKKWAGRTYLYEVDVFVPSTGVVETNQVTDPYSVALTLNSTRSVLVDLDDRALQPALWRHAKAPRIGDEVDQTIYELHVRDFSISDPDVPAEHRGSYLAFADDGYGTRHLEDLAEAGMNTVHLLPTFDIASIEEDPAAQTSPDCDLESFAPDSSEQQACVKAQAGTDAFNWGYDPWHFFAPEGSYASTADAAHGGTRVKEFRTMVGGLHDSGMRVVLDQVYNHTAQSGQGEKSVLDKVVPGYYHRLNAMGVVETSTCCQNVATEHAMAEKLMVDALVVWARDYKVDGFRFDLMGHHSRDNMEAARAALDELTVRKDGVDGRAITLYGEGWDFGEVAGNRLFYQAIQGQLDGTSIGTFNDRLRDAVRGGGPFDEDPRKQGFGSGEFTDPNGAPVNGDEAAQQRSLAHDTDLVQIGLAGNLRDFQFRSAETSEVVSGVEVDYNGAPAAYAEDPDEVINYVDAHDNETLFDSLTMKLPPATTMEDRVRMNTLSLATVTLGQSPSFWHAGADLLRSKSLDRNSYDSGDWFNLLDFTMTDNGFGRGLAPEADNGAKWDYMRPLLADPALAPEPEDIATSAEAAQELIELRFSTPLFRLGTAEAIEEKLTFPVSGTDDAHDGVIVMRIDDTVGTDVDPELDGLVVVFNASDKPVAQVIPGLSGASLSLSPVQAGGADEVVKTSSWDAASGILSVPARTVAVFVQD